MAQRVTGNVRSDMANFQLRVARIPAILVQHSRSRVTTVPRRWLRSTRLRSAMLVLLACAATSAAGAQDAIPPELHGWEAWVLHDHPRHRCPWLVTGTPADEERICAWPGNLDLQVDARGSHFSQRWQVAADSWLPLPGNGEYWPEAVTLDGKPAPLVMRDGGPAVRVPPGTATVSGVLHWMRRPEVLPLASAISLIDLTIDGARIPAPQRTGAGVMLGAPAVARQDDHVELRVFRLLEDALPAILTTQLRLTVAGESRELRLSGVLPDGFVPTAIDGELAARLDPDDTLHVQARPGDFTLVIEARGPSPVNEVRLGARAAPWPAQEVWSFRAREQLRTASVEGVVPTDPAQADVPGEWRTLPAYHLDGQSRLHLVERTRGAPAQDGNTLQLQRTAWLDFSGKGYTLVDTLSGDMRRGWRLDMVAPYVLQSAWTTADDEVPLLITAGPATGLTGVELREPHINLQTLSQVRRVSARLPANGWHARFTQVSGQLIVGPGYRLLAALGPDSAPQAWLERWRLLDIFGVLLVAIVAWRLLGIRTALIALAALVLSDQESGAPTWLWLNILIALALLGAAPEGRLKRWAALYRWLAVAALVVALVPFAVTQARLALYPQLEALELLPPEAALSLPAPQANIEPERRALEVDQISHRFADLARQNAPAPPPPASLRLPIAKAVSGTAAQDVVVTAGRASAVEEMRYEPGALVQAGPGIPSWRYHVYPYRWSGPVEANATVRFIISPPWLTRLWRVLGVALSVLLLYELTRNALPNFPPGWRGGRVQTSALLALLAVAISTAAPRPAQAAQTPDPSLLSDLQARLLERPKCQPTCADISSAAVSLAGARLNLVLEVSALDSVGVPLPGAEPGWSPDLVQIDGVAAGGVYRDASGTRYVKLAAGHHVVRIEGPLGATEALSLGFRMPPRVIEVHAPGWDVAGVSERHLVSGALQLARRRVVVAVGGAGATRQEEFPPFVRVDRLFNLAHDWTIATTVSRVAPRSAAFTVSLPLLPNEAVTTPGLTARDGTVTLGLAVGEPAHEFSSSLPPSETLELVAPPQGARGERWRFNVAANWHVDFSGTPAVLPADGAPVWLFEYYPRPGEHLTLHATRPAATPGGTLAFDQVQLQSSVGERSRDSTLTLSYRSTQGGPQTLHLPAEAQVTRVLSDGEPNALRPEHGALSLTALPGSHTWTIDWQTPVGVRLMTHSPLVTLAAPASNLRLSLRVPEDRWVLYTFGRGVGPTILYWGELTLFIVLAGLIGRSRLTPLATREWLLLGAGLSTFSWGVFAVFLVFIAVFEWRARGVPRANGRRYNLLQAACALLAVMAIAAVVMAVPQGLLARPDMRITPDSYSGELAWFVDQTASELPSPAVLSVSLWWYKIAMLAWALWLSFALTRWIRWAWGVFARDGVWHRAPLAPLPAERATPGAPAPDASQA